MYVHCAQWRPVWMCESAISNEQVSLVSLLVTGVGRNHTIYMTEQKWQHDVSCSLLWVTLLFIYAGSLIVRKKWICATVPKVWLVKPKFDLVMVSVFYKNNMHRQIVLQNPCKRIVNTNWVANPPCPVIIQNSENLQSIYLPYPNMPKA